MVRTWLGKPLPWIVLGLLFWVGRRATWWREAFFRSEVHDTLSEFHETILWGFAAIFHDVVIRFESLFIAGCVALVMLTVLEYSSPSTYLLRVSSCLRTWRSLQAANTSATQWIKLCWAALSQRPLEKSGYYLPIVLSRLRWLFVFVISFGASSCSFLLMKPTSTILNQVTTGSLEKCDPYWGLYQLGYTRISGFCPRLGMAACRRNLQHSSTYAVRGQ